MRITFTAGPIPIAEWAGSSFVGTNNVEYYSYFDPTATTAATTYSDQSKVVRGPSGSQFANIAAATGSNSRTTYSINLPSDYQPTDVFELQICRGNENSWTSLASGGTDIRGLHTENGTLYGIGLQTGSGTLDVIFGNGGRTNSGTTFGSAGAAWSAVDVTSTWKWRVVRHSAGVPVGFGNATGSQSGLLPPTTSMTDILATQLGHKTYYHGTTYNGGTAPTVTCSIGGLTVYRGAFIPYLMQDGTWRLKFNIAIAVTSGTRTSADISVNGITSKNISNFIQAVSLSISTNAGIAGAQILPNTDAFVCSHASATLSGYRISGDIELESRPTWAYA
jgi:hypothetical protein